MPRERRMALIAVIISLSDSYIHRINQRPYAFLEITNILGPKTFIGFASINLYLIEAGFYERYFESLCKEWSEVEVEKILNRSFSSLLFSYWIRRLWLERDKVKEATDRLEALKGLLNTIWSTTTYTSVFYEALVFFKQQLPDLVDYFDEGGIKMKSFVDTMPKAVRDIYEEVLVRPVVKKYGEKLRQVELEKKLEVERERAERERAERERAEKELRATCLQAVANKFPDISAKALLTINQLSFSQCNKLLIELGVIADVHNYELFLKKLS